MKLRFFYFLAWMAAINFCNLQAKDFRDQNFFIKKNYVSRTSYTRFDDSSLHDEFQDEIYFAAHHLAENHHYTKIGDIGYCHTIGFEIQPTLDFLFNTYPNKNWQVSDFSKLPNDQEFDVLICSDVIEHLVNPDDLLNWIDQLHFNYLVISTPNRELLTHIWNDKVYGPQSQSGPPVNIAHVREWSFDEFERYLSEYFDIVDHFHCEKEFYGQVVIAVKKQNAD